MSIPPKAASTMAYLGPKAGVACWISGRYDTGVGISVKEFPSTFCVAEPERARFRAGLKLAEVWGGRYMPSGLLRSETQQLSMGDSEALSLQTLACSKDRPEEWRGWTDDES